MNQDTVGSFSCPLTPSAVQESSGDSLGISDKIQLVKQVAQTVQVTNGSSQWCARVTVNLSAEFFWEVVGHFGEGTQVSYRLTVHQNDITFINYIMMTSLIYYIMMTSLI